MLYHPETDDFELIKIEGKEGRHVTNIMELHNGEVWESPPEILFFV